MKVILNKDLAPLGEEGDVRDVARGYARNFLYPRGIAFPYNEKTIKLFESRREAIEERKIRKRGDAAGLKEKLESLNLEITMPAGPNGKLYGAVTGQTIADEFTKLGFQIERKKIELSLPSLKNVGKYKVTVKLYENASAEVAVNVMGQEIKTETKKAAPARPGKRRRDSAEHVPPEHVPTGHAASESVSAEQPEAEPSRETYTVSSSEAPAGFDQ
jgi:large subunit ribosomal protein L9